MNKQSSPMDKAIEKLWERRTFSLNERLIVVACLIREYDWRPLKAEWWRGKEACIIGADLSGNFLLRHCDGTVRIWEHELQSDRVLAPSIRDFLKQLK